MANAVYSIGGEDHVVVTAQARYLTDDEISRFLDDLDHNGDGMIDYDEVEQKLHAAHEELVPQPREHNFMARKKTMLLRRMSRLSHVYVHSNMPTPTSHLADDLDPHDEGNLTTTTTHATATSRGAISRSHSHAVRKENLRHEFLRSIIGSDARQIPRAEFAKRVKEWNIPSFELHEAKDDYMRKVSIFRRIRAYWAVHGPEIAFLMLVIGLQIAFGTWQLVKYTTGSQYRNAFGWGVGMAKAFAGALYPTMFFLIISMSRYAATFLRRSYYVSRFINWDLSQSFHIKIAIVALVFATLHAVGHFTGTFNVGSRPDREDEVALVLGTDDVPVPYSHYIVSIPGLSGITALSLFYLLALLSMPQVRRWNYEVFQLGHLLMYPIIGLLFSHGTSGFLQWPMLGYWMAAPTLLIVVERVVRLAVGFHKINATIKILDGDTVEVSVMIPSGRIWAYKPGQYVFFQVPQISRFQWHPFTVSVCHNRKMQLHIKTDGNWTGKLRELANESGEATEIVVGINGPFGAPAQRFYDFNHSIVVGSGIGVTPFTGILADLQAKDDEVHGGPGPVQKMQEWNGFSSPESERLPTLNENEPTGGGDTRPALGEKRQTTHAKSKTDSSKKTTPAYRRVDFHWTVRERNYLLWMSELLNNVFNSQQWRRQQKLDEQQQRQLARQQDPGPGVGPGENVCPRARRPSYIPPPNIPSPAASIVSNPLSHPQPAEDGGGHSPTTPSTEKEAHSTATRQRQRQRQADEEEFDTLPSLDIRIHTHVTGILSKSRSIATHVYAWLLEMHRTAAQPASPLTGLLNPTQFGRPDFVTILDAHYEDMLRLKARDLRLKEAERQRKEKEKREREREKKEREVRDKEEKDREKRGRIGDGYSKSSASVNSFRSAFGSRHAVNNASSVGGGGGNTARGSVVSFGGGGGYGNGRNSNPNVNFPGSSSTSTNGRTDSLYVFSSSISRNQSSSSSGLGPASSADTEEGLLTKTEETNEVSPAGSTPTEAATSTTRASLAGNGRGGEEVLRVGVFYCGTPAVGEILADRCRALTARGHAEGSGIEYHFMTEVFG